MSDNSDSYEVYKNNNRLSYAIPMPYLPSNPGGPGGGTAAEKHISTAPSDHKPLRSVSPTVTESATTLQLSAAGQCALPEAGLYIFKFAPPPEVGSGLRIKMKKNQDWKVIPKIKNKGGWKL